MTIEELLRRRQGQVSFQAPFTPQDRVEALQFEMTVRDSGVRGLQAEYGVVQGNHVSFEQTQVDTSSFPGTMKGSFEPSLLPEEGIVNVDEQCFEHIFSPDAVLDDLGVMPRSILFVIDTSGSMQGQKLDDAKEALSQIIETLSGQDVLAVQSFNEQGSRSLWGPENATNDEKLNAIRFVYNLNAGGGTNLEAALVEGIMRSLETALVHDSVPVMMFLTDGQATSGIQEPVRIAKNVRLANEDRGVKLFSLAFGEDADYQLLNALALQNEDVSERIHDGFGDSASQIEGFFWDEFGTVLLKDLNIMVEGDGTKSQTSTSFPVYAEGSEMVMRGLVSEGSVSENVAVTTSAESNNGPISWTTTASVVTNAETGQCFQSFAHSRIKELLSFRDAAQLLGDDMESYSPLSEPCYSHLQLCAENEALKLALESQLVWPGLTSIVTTEDETCQAFKETGVCYDDGMGGIDGEDGTYVPTGDSTWDGIHHGSTPSPVAAPAQGGYGSNGNDNDYYYGGSSTRAYSWWIVLIALWLALTQ